MAADCRRLAVSDSIHTDDDAINATRQCRRIASAVWIEHYRLAQCLTLTHVTAMMALALTSDDVLDFTAQRLYALHVTAPHCTATQRAASDVKEMFTR